MADSGTQSTQISVGLFFTRGIGVDIWKKKGMYQREVSLYKVLAQAHSVRSTFFTYDPEEYNDVVTKAPAWMPNILYSILLPFMHGRTLKTCDVYKTNQMDGAWTALIAKWLYKKPLIVRCGYEWYLFSKQIGRSRLYCEIIKFIERFVYNRADHIILTSKHDAMQIQTLFSLPKEKITVVPNFIDTKKFSAQASYKDNATHVTTLARLHPQKNLHALIDAIAKTDMTLSIISNGPLRKELEEYARSLNADVRFLGNIPNDRVGEMFANADIFILPSLFEGYPKALLEAMSVGLPCIASRVPGNIDIITDKENGILCETTTGSIYDALVLLQKNVDMRRRLGTAARQWIEDTVSLERIAAKERAVYSNVLSL